MKGKKITFKDRVQTIAKYIMGKLQIEAELSDIRICLDLNIHPETLRRYGNFILEMYPSLERENGIWKEKSNTILAE